MSTLYVANIHFNQSGTTQVKFQDNKMRFQFGSNNDALDGGVITTYTGKIAEANPSSMINNFPANSYIISLNSTAPQGHTVVTGTGYPSYVYVYKKI